MDLPPALPDPDPEPEMRGAPGPTLIESPASRLSLLPEELSFKRLMKWLGFAWLAAAIAYVLVGAYVQNSSDPPCVEIRSVFNGLMVIGLAIKVFILGLLSFAVMGDVRRARLPVVQSMLAHVFTLLLSIAIFFGLGYKSEQLPLHCITPGLPAGALPPANVRLLLTASVLFDVAVCVLMFRALRRANRAQYPGLRYFTPLEFEVLVALADVLLVSNTRSAESTREVIPAGKIASNVEYYFAGMRGRAKARLRLALAFLEVYPLRWLHPPFSLMNPADRFELLSKHFHDDVISGRWPRKWLAIKKTVLMAARQLVYIGYYNDPATFSSVHYLPFEQRERFKVMAAARTSAPLAAPPSGLIVESGPDLAGTEVDADIVIIGSGAGASILAHELVRAGKHVLMLERGPHIRPDAFTPDEVRQMSALYSDGALQMTRSLGFQVLQGRCVGGTTVVNNAISFDLPEAVLQRWNTEHRAGLDPDALAQSFAKIKALLHVQSQGDAHLNPGGKQFIEGIQALGLGRGDGAQPVPANISQCLGCGYCNIGCKYGRKLSMLNHVLPMTQAAGPGSLRIIAGCDVRQILHKSGVATGVACELDAPASAGARRARSRTLNIKARTVFVAGGAVSSSVLLLRSGLGNSNVGKRLSFNIGAVMTGQFARTLNAYDGLQMSHYCVPDASGGMLLETWFNPPVAQSLTMPGWFADHFGNMTRYHRMMCVGALFGSESTGTVKLPQFGPIRQHLIDRARENPKLDWLYSALYPSYIHFEPGTREVDRVIDGLKLAGRVLLEAGAQRVMPNASFNYLVFEQDAYKQKSVNSAAEDYWSGFETLRKNPHLLLLGSAHPQGGNAISTDAALGVVDENFRVHGCENVFVADASVFPSSVGVNPQLTVMALAHYATHRWLANQNVPGAVQGHP